MKNYQAGTRRRRWPRRLFVAIGIVLAVLIIAILIIRHQYNENLKPLSSHAHAQTVVITPGMSANQIGDMLYQKHIIRASWAFDWYVQNKEVRSELQAGTYSLSPSQSIPDIVSQLTHGKISTKLVTILPGQRLDQIQQSLINDGFNKADVKAALSPGQYENSPALVDKPLGNSLEGYLYPDSFQKTSMTNPKTIIEESLTEMQQHLTPGIRAAFAKEGLSTYQGIILASIVGQEVSNQSDRAQAAQVFLSRLKLGMPLGSDVTAIYGAIAAGQQQLSQGQMLSYDTPYNTLLHKGLPPTPISNVDDSSLQAVAYPASTDWLYFVAGDNGKTYFAKTLQQHEANVQMYCHKKCGQ